MKKKPGLMVRKTKKIKGGKGQCVGSQGIETHLHVSIGESVQGDKQKLYARHVVQINSF